MKESESASLPNQEHYLKKIIGIYTEIKTSAENVIRSCKTVLRNLEGVSLNKSIVEESDDVKIPAWDPGDRQLSLSGRQKRYLLQVGPHQPLLESYPVHENESNPDSHKQCRFNPTWFQEYPNLEYSKVKDAAFCFVCSLLGRPVGTGGLGGFSPPPIIC